jgi:hypothetical protein
MAATIVALCSGQRTRDFILQVFSKNNSLVNV